jgi:hypothetical protein
MMAKRTKQKRDGDDVPMGKPKPKRGRPKVSGQHPSSSTGAVTKADNQRSEEAVRASFLHHLNAWNQMRAREAVFDKVYKDTVAALKADGHSVKQMKIADALSGNAKQEAKIHGEVHDRLLVAKFIGHPMGAQLDLFSQPDRTPAVDRATDEGKQAHMEGKRASPPYMPGTPQYTAWLEAYHEAQEHTVRTKLKPLPAPDDTWGDDDGEEAGI